MIVSILVLSVTVDHYLGLLTATGGVCCTRGAPPAMLRAPREKITTLLAERDASGEARGIVQALERREERLQFAAKRIAVR